MISRYGACGARPILAAVVVTLAACGTHAPGKVNEPMDPVVADNELNLWMMARTASVLLARTVDVGRSPGVWSSSFATWQPVTVEIEEMLCGPARSGRVTIEIPLVERGRLVDRVPAVAPWLATEGARMVWFLDGDRLADDDLGGLDATPATVARVRALCAGPMPPGMPAVAAEFAAIAGAPRLAGRFAAPLTGVVDVTDPRGATITRLTVAGGVVRAFSGIRAARAVERRAADLGLRATPAQLARALTGGSPIDALVIAGSAPGLVDALAEAAEVIGGDAGLRERIERAAGTTAAP